MSEYQRFQESLQQAAAAWFSENGLTTREDRPDVLPRKSDWPGNIILPKVAAYLKANIKKADIHKHANSGLSSQAMVFNLIGPLVITNDLSPLRDAFNSEGINWPQGKAQAVFEYEDPTILGEDPKRPTSVDLAILDGNGQPHLFIEAKLREREFGGCSSYRNKKCEGLNPANDLSLCYLHQQGKRYWELMIRHCYHEGMISKMTKCILIEHYQFFRNALLASETGKTFVVLHDARSPVFENAGNGLIPQIKQLIPEKHHAHIKSVTVQQIVNAIKSSNRHEWITQFERKYGLDKYS